jgi:hypothetical protein
MTTHTVLLISAFISLVNLVSGCNTNSCANDVAKHPNDYVECDMCVCDEACGLNKDDEYYQCYIKVSPQLISSPHLISNTSWTMITWVPAVKSNSLKHGWLDSLSLLLLDFVAFVQDVAL